ncbi:hypothetical protein [Acidovorax sp.]|uniref:hypothetical protein n=1 Tax=Acidovorax sp. TaxID=1872122 RepID=UPI00391FBF3E
MSTLSSNTYGFSKRFAAIAAAAGCAVSTSTALAFPAVTTGGTASAWTRGSADGSHLDSRQQVYGATTKEFGQKARSTTDRERLIASLRGYLTLQENWDGEGAAAPNLNSLRAAMHFACALTDEVLAPAPMLHASGNAGLLWEEDGLYGELEFLHGSRAAYYFECGSNKHKGIVQLPAVEVPAILQQLLPKA